MEQARSLAADSIGELMGFWNFKPSMGRVWTELYLSPSPLTADEIQQATGMSTGTVSMTLHDLIDWRVVQRADDHGNPEDRKKRYAAETDIMAMVTRVFAQRELALVGKIEAQLTTAATLAREHAASSRPREMLERSFVLTRIERLAEIAAHGRTLVTQLGRVGTADLRGLRRRDP
jgi:DNA-binding transcriptional regulator GbsR (MarR family)